MEHPASAIAEARRDHQEFAGATDLDSVRQALSASLPVALRTAMAAYHGFAATGIPNEPKAFASYHAGCRAALAHMESLVKLIRWTEATGTGATGIDEDPPAQLIAEARAALQGLSNRG